MPFLRSPSFASLLLLDKSAIYLISNHCHSEGRREAEGRQDGLIAGPLPFHVLLASWQGFHGNLSVRLFFLSVSNNREPVCLLQLDFIV